MVLKITVITETQHLKYISTTDIELQMLTKLYIN